MAAESQKITAPVTGTATVSIASKLPISLRCVIHEAQERREVTSAGYREVKQFYPTETEFVIYGNAHGQNEGPRRKTVFGYAITRGIPKALWDKWSRDNEALPALKKGLIFAMEKEASLGDAAKENRAAKTGLERVNPKALPQTDPRFKVQTADEQVAEIAQVEEFA